MVVDDRFGVEPICTVLKDAGVQIAPSTYYAARNRAPSARAVRDAELIVDIRNAHKANLGVYGVRKIHDELNRDERRKSQSHEFVYLANAEQRLGTLLRH